MPPADAPPARFVDGYLLYLLARASHAVSAEFHARLRARGVPVPVWRVLATLWGEGAATADAGETVGALAAACLMQQPTMTKLLDRMEKEGLVRRAPDPSDGRVTRVRLTARGRAMASGLVEVARTHEAEVLARHAPGAADAIKALLRDLVARHESGASPP